MKNSSFSWQHSFVTIVLLLALDWEVSAQSNERDQCEYYGNFRVDGRTHNIAAMYNVDSRIYGGTPEHAARQFLEENKSLFGISDLSDLRSLGTTEGPASQHVGFLQYYLGVPVFCSESVVSLDREKRVSMVICGCKLITGLESVTPSVPIELAVKNAIARVNAEEGSLIMPPKAGLFILHDSLGRCSLVWKVNFVANEPIGDWQVFVDARSGKVLRVADIGLHYVSGQGRVFRPDPITALQNASLTNQNDADYPALQPAYKTVALPNLNDPISGTYRLRGKYASSEDVESPNTAPVTSSTSAFLFNRSQPGFEETNAYYFIDAQRQYIGQLGFAPKWNGNDYIPFDAHGANSWYNPDLKYIAFGDYLIDEGEDQDVVMHEYTHALHDALMDGGLSPAGFDELAISEGSGDYMALSYRKTISSFQTDHVFNWVGNGEHDNGRTLNSAFLFPNDWTGDWHDPAGVLWASTIVDIEDAIGSRDVSSTLLLRSFMYVAPSGSVIDHVNAMLQADRDYYGGAHLSSLASVFDARGFFSGNGNVVFGAITSNTTWTGNIFVTGNVSVTSGTTLTIAPGAFVFFSNGTSLAINGQLNAQGTSSNPIICDCSGGSSTWGGITFNSGSTGSIAYCTIRHATTGVTATGMIPSIQNCTISNNTNGIWVSGAGNSTAPMAYNTIQYNTGYGIYLNQSSPRYVHHNNISYNHNASNNAVGIYCYSASAPYLSYDVLTNNDIALSCANSPAWLITYATPPGQDVIKSNLGGILAVTSNVFLNYSNSSIYQNTNYAISEQFYSTVSAQYNYWHRENYPNCVLASDFLTYRGGSISYTPALCTDPNPMGKIAVGGSIAESPVLSSETSVSNSSTGPGFFDSELLAALDAMVLHNYDKAIAIYLPRFKKETSAEKRIYVLQQLAECYRAAEKPDFSSLLTTDIRPGLSKGDSLYTLSVDLEAMSLMAQKRYDDAAACWKALVDNVSAQEYIRKHALFDLGYLALVYKNDQTAAIPYFNRLKSSYPGDELTRQSVFLLDRASASASAPPAPLVKEDRQKPEEYTLDKCFPNPFNPTTTIRFGLPRDAHVKLVVYDILGREVAHLAEGFQQAGFHTVNWNAQNAASGMYFARLTVTNELGKVAYSVTNKLLLTK